LVPWSAINLADYYVVRKGEYSIDQMFRLDGIYGRYRWNSIGVCQLSILLQTRFMSLSFYVGPVARLIGTDIAWLPGLVIPAALYCFVETSQAQALNANARRHIGHRRIDCVISKRLVKKQRMRWTQRGAHLLLQTRVQVLNDDLRKTFGCWFPGMKAEEPAVLKQAA
jgi:hypothetical protein